MGRNSASSASLTNHAPLTNCPDSSIWASLQPVILLGIGLESLCGIFDHNVVDWLKVVVSFETSTVLLNHWGLVIVLDDLIVTWSWINESICMRKLSLLMINQVVLSAWRRYRYIAKKLRLLDSLLGEQVCSGLLLELGLLWILVTILCASYDMPPAIIAQKVVTELLVWVLLLWKSTIIGHHHSNLRLSIHVYICRSWGALWLNLLYLLSSVDLICGRLSCVVMVMSMAGVRSDATVDCCNFV